MVDEIGIQEIARSDDSGKSAMQVRPESWGLVHSASFVKSRLGICVFDCWVLDFFHHLLLFPLFHVWSESRPEVDEGDRSKGEVKGLKVHFSRANQPIPRDLLCSGFAVRGTRLEERTMPLPWALLLLFLPGCVLARNFTEVKGIVGEPLSVQCPYKEEYKMYGKYWCRGNFWVSCSIIIKTESKEGEVKSGRVAISDSHRNLTFTVTMENLTADDAGSYACGINKGLIISWFRVSISQGKCLLLPAPGVLNLAPFSLPNLCNELFSCLSPWLILTASWCVYLGAGETGTMNTCAGGYLLVHMSVLMNGNVCGCVQLYVHS
uniref:Ig-like domain-containing protein n=1 Tax=Ornithorhynchus anatinus TaxID=9258 RepID=A0A6I8P1V7_ORNAN